MLNFRSRFAAASGVAGVGVVGALVAQTVPGTVATAMVAAVAAAASGPAMAVSVGEDVADRAREALLRHSRFAPTFAFAAVAACFRAGGSAFRSVAGAHAVVGIALIRGPFATVTGMWLCLLAASIAIAGSTSETFGDEAGIADRLALVAAGAQVVLITALFAGPQLRSINDLVPWAIVSAVIALSVWFGRPQARAAAAPWVAFALAGAGLGFSIVGGRP
ncbi:MAG: hypothetical protein NVS9B12_11910 [Vulcanimicrobiaceae bacterium]